MTSTPCTLCATLAQGGVTTDMQEVCPPEAARLTDVGPTPGSDLRRCPECGAFYRYRYHYDYNALGPSWDEYYLWRLEEPAQEALRALLAAPEVGRDAALEATLRHPCDHAREGGAIVALIQVKQGGVLGERSLVAACELLADRVYYAGMFAYLALLESAQRGRSREVLAALQATGTAAEPRFGRIVARECAGALG